MTSPAANNSIGGPKIVIVGSGIDVLQSALAAARLLSFAKPSIIVVEVDAPVGSAVMASFSDMAHFHGLLGISEGAFIKGSFSGLNFGTKLCSGTDCDDFVFSDGPYGFIMEGLGFHELFAKTRTARPQVKYDDYCLSAVLASANRIAPRSLKAKSIFSTVRYGYQFQRQHYLAYLRTLLQEQDVTFLRTSSLSIKNSVGSSAAASLLDELSIESVIIDSGQVITGDLFIDCSTHRIMVSERIGAHKLVEVQPSVLPPFCVEIKNRTLDQSEYRAGVRLDLFQGGFAKHIEHLGLATAERLRYLGPFESKKCNELVDYQSPFLLTRPWSGNCVAIGAACTNMPSPLPGAYHVLQNQLLLLFDVWTGGLVLKAARDVFNDFSTQSIHHNLDIANILLYRYADKPALLELTQANKDRVQLFECSGAVRPTENPVIADDHWVALLIALGYQQCGQSLKSCSIDQSLALEHLDRLRSMLVTAAEAAEPYEHWISKNLNC